MMSNSCFSIKIRVRYAVIDLAEHKQRRDRLKLEFARAAKHVNIDTVSHQFQNAVSYDTRTKKKMMKIFRTLVFIDY